jgi:hypothetical protein
VPAGLLVAGEVEVLLSGESEQSHGDSSREAGRQREDAGLPERDAVAVAA